MCKWIVSLRLTSVPIECAVRSTGRPFGGTTIHVSKPSVWYIRRAESQTYHGAMGLDGPSIYPLPSHQAEAVSHHINITGTGQIHTRVGNIRRQNASHSTVHRMLTSDSVENLAKWNTSRTGLHGVCSWKGAIRCSEISSHQPCWHYQHTRSLTRSELSNMTAAAGEPITSDSDMFILFYWINIYI